MNISEMRFMKLIPYMLSILLALLIFNFSLNPDMWAKILEALNIPPNNMPFSDYKAHLSFLKCQELGIDINSQECILIPDGNGKINSHPRLLVTRTCFEGREEAVGWAWGTDRNIDNKKQT